MKKGVSSTLNIFYYPPIVYMVNILGVDDIVDTKATNATVVGNYLTKLDGTLQLFNAMKADCVSFENDLAVLAEQVTTEGSVTESQLADYNTKLCAKFACFQIYLDTKVASSSGIATYLICPWTTTSKVGSCKLSIMDTGYRWYRCKDMCSVDCMKVCQDCDICGSASRYPINVGCGTAYFDSVSKNVADFDANTLYKLDANCHQIYVDVGATYSGTDPQDKAASALASDFTFTFVDSNSVSQTITFSNPSPGVTYDDVFGNPGTDGAKIGSVTFPVSVASGSLCNVSGTAITEITFNLSANYTAANTGTEFDTVTVTGTTLTTKRMGFSTVNDFVQFLCHAMPPYIHKLLSLLDKNCIIITKCIDSVNGLIVEFDLYS